MEKFYLIFYYVNWMVRSSITHFLIFFISRFNHKTSDWKCFRLPLTSSGSDVTRDMDNTAKMGKTWI